MLYRIIFYSQKNRKIFILVYIYHLFDVFTLIYHVLSKIMYVCNTLQFDVPIEHQDYEMLIYYD